MVNFDEMTKWESKTILCISLIVIAHSNIYTLISCCAVFMNITLQAFCYSLQARDSSLAGVYNNTTVTLSVSENSLIEVSTYVPYRVDHMADAA